MAFLGYFMVFLVLLPGSPVSILLLLIPFTGSVVFLNYLRKREISGSRWRAGIFYPVLISGIIAINFCYLIQNIYPGYFIIVPGILMIPYLLIAPASVSLFAAMPQDFRKKVGLTIIIVSVLSFLILMIPFYDILIGLLNPQYVADYALSDVTGGFIILIFVVFLGMPVLFIAGIITGIRLSGLIKEEQKNEANNEPDERSVNILFSNIFSKNKILILIPALTAIITCCFIL